MLCFEVYRDTVALRITKLLSPVTCSPGYTLSNTIPEEGKLVQSRTPGRCFTNATAPWAPWTMTAKKAERHLAIQELIRRAKSRRLEQL